MHAPQGAQGATTGRPLYAIPGAGAGAGVTMAATGAPAPGTEPDAAAAPVRTVADVLASTQVEAVLDELDRELIGLAPVKQRIRDIAALLVIDRLRAAHGLAAQAPSLHMCFTGNPGTGKTTVASRMAQILHRLGYLRRGHLVAVTRDDLVGQYIGHTAPKTREVLKKAMGGVLFIDEAYYLYRPENERDYGQEAIEILLQVMENQRDDIVVILAGYRDRMDTFFRSNPGLSSRIAHHLDFPDYAADELMRIAQLMLHEQSYRFDDAAATAFGEYLVRRLRQPHFANARSVRNALDRARLRQASRLFADRTHELARDDLVTLRAEDIRASRLFTDPPDLPALIETRDHAT
jgi:probable Rubsico expression protein CbbX